MSASSGPTAAEMKDRHAGLAALGVLALGFKFAADAAMHLLGEDWTGLLHIASTALGLAAVLLVSPIVVWKLRHRDAKQRRSYFSDQSYTVTTFRRAHVASWAATVSALIVLELMSKRLPQLASAFFLQTALAVMFASLSVSFLVLDREPGGGEPDA